MKECAPSFSLCGPTPLLVTFSPPYPYGAHQSLQQLTHQLSAFSSIGMLEFIAADVARTGDTFLQVVSHQSHSPHPTPPYASRESSRAQHTLRCDFTGQLSEARPFRCVFCSLTYWKWCLVAGVVAAEGVREVPPEAVRRRGRGADAQVSASLSLSLSLSLSRFLPLSRFLVRCTSKSTPDKL